MQPYEKLGAWRACHALVLDVYRLTAQWPPAERYGLASQIRRAAVSAASNIVEGRARPSTRDYNRFVGIANGSLAEVGYLIRVASDVGLLRPEGTQLLEQRREAAARQTSRLCAALRAKLGQPALSPVPRPRSP